MPNALDAFDLADTIFLDANILLFHAFADPRHGEAARRFLERVELAHVNVVTSVLVENEVLFKILLQEAAGHLDNPAVWNVRRALWVNPTFREQVHRPARRYLGYIGMLTNRGLTLVDVTVDQTRQVIDLACQTWAPNETMPKA
jgi:predicted nucleic acid-binding protein